jgi:hypothetical protein
MHCITGLNWAENAKPARFPGRRNWTAIAKAAQFPGTPDALSPVSENKNAGTSFGTRAMSERDRNPL